ncbi:hypothetical protein PUR57_00360 [Streptomyces sp. JV176]|nr:hypothetical protein [Streptomyces sp. JV176]MEE1797166.1 hypothetical protein [Streptomyces sp. JV176]
MKPMKVAAVVAGSMVVLGAAAPAFAAEAKSPSFSLNGALDTVASEGLRDAKPLHTNALDTENEGSALNAVKGVTDSLNKPQQGNKLLGGLPLGK